MNNQTKTGYEGPKNMRMDGGYLECPACYEAVGFDSDPCAYCHKAFHDRCFYTRDHGCVRNGDIPHDPTYGTQARRDAENRKLRSARATAQEGNS